ncbi:Mammalian cell entry related domain protein [Denitrovibrio acetiphilus DSM 12809]|uniref:Mammalian cell entry related domain protein n=1 Tax=Denitrovibrio acetiphilus (strain DSM 12809 / NBRC 114555 / N2460) TaxID=522772 RepID=D4H824_DENA2|nr:MlaD family protein [Denitrovibrio acetiphilus]ADD68173.1 Mammalian cell entry related domain protein [Denitrovibrio acetiphilus DSM 12809]
MNFGLEAKVGVFVVGCLLLISAMSLRLVDFSFSDSAGVKVTTILNDAAGLTKDSPVIFSGVEVGKIREIKLENRKAVAELLINDQYELPANLKVLVRSKGFLGEKYAEFQLDGDIAQGILKDGDILTQGNEGTDIDQLTNKLGGIADDVQAITASLREVLATDQAKANMSVTISNIRDITDSVNKLVQNNEQRIDTIIMSMETLTTKLSEITVANTQNINDIMANINAITTDLKAQTPLISENLRVVTESLKNDGPTIASNVRSITDDVDEVMSSQKENLKKAIENIAEVSDKLGKTVDNLNEITGKVNSGEGTIGRLVNDEDTVDNLNGALTGLRDTLGKIDQFKVDLAFSAERYGEVDNSKGHVEVKITPGRKRYYLLGLSSDQDGTTETTNTSIHREPTHGSNAASGEDSLSYYEEKEEQNPDAMLWTLQYAHRFWDNFFFRVGLKESEAGIGLDYHPFTATEELEDKFVFKLDAYDFPDEDEDREVHMKAGLKYKFYKNLFITGGYDDFLNSDTDSWFVGAGVEFRDDDLKYLLGKTPMPN